MSATIIRPEILEAKRREREQQRRQRELLRGSILGLLDDEDDPPCAPASPARDKETRR